MEELTDGALVDAEPVAEATKAGGWAEIMRDALALRQSMEAARNKLLLARLGIAARAPS